MKMKTTALTILALAALSRDLAQAASFSDLKVVQEAAQSGSWTMTTTGVLANGSPMKPTTRTVCATREEVLKSMSNPFVWNEKTGEEDKTCPTVLTTDTSTLGVATMQCAAIKIDLPGQKVTIPANKELATEFKRTGKQTWTVKTGAVLTNITYHGSATAGCIVKR